MTKRHVGGLIRGASLSPPRTSRRSLVRAAAWSAPVILASTTLPALAASAATTLAFTVYPSDFEPGEASSGGVLYATKDGVYAGGELITITLSPGLTWAGGTNLTSARSLVTDSRGRIVLTGANELTAASYGTYSVAAHWAPTDGHIATASAEVVCGPYVMEWDPAFSDPFALDLPYNGLRQLVARTSINGKPAINGTMTVEPIGNAIVNGNSNSFTMRPDFSGNTTLAIKPPTNAVLGSAWGVTLTWSVGNRRLSAGGRYI